MSRKAQSVLSFDRQLAKVGDFGFYQKFSVAVSVVVIMFGFIQNASTVFTFDDRAFSCSVTNVTDACLCPEAEMQFAPQPPSAVSKYRLVCGRQRLARWSRFSYFVGLSVGSLLMGYLADRYGRKPVVILSCLTVFICGMFAPFMPNIVLYSVLRVMVAVGVAGFMNLYFVQLFESMGSNSRSMFAIIYTMAGSLGNIVLGLLGHVFKDFVILENVIAICYALVGLLLLVTTVESPLWLYNQGYQQKYRNTLKVIARVNGNQFTSSTSELKINVKTRTKQSRSVSIWDIFISRWTTLTTLLTWYFSFAVSFTCYGLMFHALLFNKSVNLVIGGLLEIAMECVILLWVNRFPRKILLVFLSVSAACLMTSCVVLSANGYHSEMGFFVLTIGARSTTMANWALLRLITGEIYPTVLRGWASGIVNFISRFSIMTTVFIDALTLQQASAPFLLITVVLVLLAVVSLHLPETFGVSLPNTISDFNAFCGEHIMCWGPHKESPVVFTARPQRSDPSERVFVSGEFRTRASSLGQEWKYPEIEAYVQEAGDPQDILPPRPETGGRTRYLTVHIPVE